MGFQPVKALNPFDGLIDPFWVPGDGNKSVTEKIFSIKGIALLGLAAYIYGQYKSGGK